jgi:hypothetical protein
MTSLTKHGKGLPITAVVAKSFMRGHCAAIARPVELITVLLFPIKKEGQPAQKHLFLGGTLSINPHVRNQRIRKGEIPRFLDKQKFPISRTHSQLQIDLHCDVRTHSSISCGKGCYRQEWNGKRYSTHLERCFGCTCAWRILIYCEIRGFLACSTMSDA